MDVALHGKSDAHTQPKCVNDFYASFNSIFVYFSSIFFFENNYIVRLQLTLSLDVIEYVVSYLTQYCPFAELLSFMPELKWQVMWVRNSSCSCRICERAMQMQLFILATDWIDSIIHERTAPLTINRQWIDSAFASSHRPFVGDTWIKKKKNVKIIDCCFFLSVFFSFFCFVRYTARQVNYLLENCDDRTAARSTQKN